MFLSPCCLLHEGAGMGQILLLAHLCGVHKDDTRRQVPPAALYPVPFPLKPSGTSQDVVQGLVAEYRIEPFHRHWMQDSPAVTALSGLDTHTILRTIFQPYHFLGRGMSAETSPSPPSLVGNLWLVALKCLAFIFLYPI